MQQRHIKISEVQFSNAEFLPKVVEMINEGHTVTLRLRGVSMRPFLEDNRDKALLTKPISPKKGDPVLAEVEPRHYVLHRITDIHGDNITLRGDGNLAYEHCKMENIVAGVIGFYRKDRKKLDKTNGWKWKTYSCVWLTLSPMRRYLLAAYRRLWIPLFGPI
jgi:hypothetical protein